MASDKKDNVTQRRAPTARELAMAQSLPASRSRGPTIVRASHERAFAAFVEAQGAKPFRRQDLAEVLRPHTTPRSLETARRLADVFLERLRTTNKVEKAGHVHWRLVVPAERKLHSGRMVPELPEVQKLALDTRCPQKWAAVDLETGQVWAGSTTGWKSADGVVRTEVAAILAQKGAVA